MKIAILIISVLLIGLILYQEDPEDSNPFNSQKTISLFANRKTRGYMPLLGRITAVFVVLLFALIFIGGKI